MLISDINDNDFDTIFGGDVWVHVLLEGAVVCVGSEISKPEKMGALPVCKTQSYSDI